MFADAPVITPIDTASWDARQIGAADARRILQQPSSRVCSNLSDMNVETPETTAARIRRALPHVLAQRSIVASDRGLNTCGATLPTEKCPQ